MPLPVLAKRRRVTLPIACVVAVAVMLVVSGPFLLTLQARPGAAVAAVFPPWWTPESVFRAAVLSGVDIIGVGATSNVIIVSARNVAELGGLYSAGAWSLIRTATPGCFGLLATGESRSL